VLKEERSCVVRPVCSMDPFVKNLINAEQTILFFFLYAITCMDIYLRRLIKTQFIFVINHGY